MATKPFPDATRLALLSCLRAVAGNFGAHVGIKCSSFCKMNIGTSMRSACATIGHALFESVSLSNALLERTILNLAQKLKNICYCQLVHGSRCSSQIRFSKTPFPYRASQGLDILCPSRRTVLLLAVVTCMGGVWTLEQPDGSVLQFYHTFRYFLASVQMAGGPYSVPS